MDSIDIKLLDLMQQNANMTVQQMAEKVHLSTTPCWKRINQLIKFGFIDKTVSLINCKKVGLDVIAIVFITIDNHNKEKIDAFSEAIKGFPEILECYRMSGEIDYLLRVIVKDINHYDNFYKQLIEKVNFIKVKSNFAIEEVKFTTQLPLISKSD